MGRKFKEGAWRAWLIAIFMQAFLSPVGRADSDFIRPFFSKNCFACHGEQTTSAGLDLKKLLASRAAGDQTKNWARVLGSLRSGRMPPRGFSVPSKTELGSVEHWIEGLLASQPTDGSPGRVTVRRLNRTEYNNTVGDLLGVTAKPADLFPLDDSGYGFDNNGDVLSLSPLLMEKIMRAAGNVSRLAVYGPDLPARPGLLVRLMPKTAPGRTGDEASGNAVTILGYSIRGSLYGSYDFPKDAEYEIRLAPSDRRGQEPPANAGTLPTPDQREPKREKLLEKFPAVQWLLTLDDQVIKKGAHAGGFAYDDGAVAETVIRLRVKAGTHSLRVFFPDLTDAEDPTRNLLRASRMRALATDWLDIAGPFDPSSSPRNKKIFVCSGQSAACTREIVENLASRAYRRPATEQEIGDLLNLVSAANTLKQPFEEGIRSVVEAILISPQFIFRINDDSRNPVSGAIHPINDWELASRLSYFLWSSMPDDMLFQAAKEGQLRQPAVLGAQVKRMLADPKSSALVENFADQWLGLRELKRRVPDPDRFPTVDDELLEFMLQETHLFVAAMIQEDRSILDFIDAPFSFLNGPLARHYGIQGVNGDRFRRVELAGEQRGGILTQGAILTASSYPTRTSVVLRGKWVLENLLGTPPPPPPPNVPVLKDSDVGSPMTLRASMEKHRNNPACASCHARMDPIGFGLENYDATGAWRDLDGKFPIDASGVLPDGKTFSGAKELKRVLRAQADLFRHNMVVKMLTYALGRGLEPYDWPTIDEIARQVKAGNDRISSLILEIVKSKPFGMRDEAAP